jgi:hypothetical protein
MLRGWTHQTGFGHRPAAEPTELDCQLNVPENADIQRGAGAPPELDAGFIVSVLRRG